MKKLVVIVIHIIVRKTRKSTGCFRRKEGVFLVLSRARGECGEWGGVAGMRSAVGLVWILLGWVGLARVGVAGSEVKLLDMGVEDELSFSPLFSNIRSSKGGSFILLSL